MLVRDLHETLQIANCKLRKFSVHTRLKNKYVEIIIYLFVALKEAS